MRDVYGYRAVHRIIVGGVVNRVGRQRHGRHLYVGSSTRIRVANVFSFSNGWPRKECVAAALPPEEHHWVDQDGKICEEGCSTSGHKVTIKLTHSQWCLFGDKVGTDTAREEGGHIGGQTYLSFGGRRVQLSSSKATSGFTTMGLTSGTGEPVMCILIFAAAEMDVLTHLGFDHQAEIPYDKDKTLEENMGPGKALPGAPTCTFRGKEVPALVAMTNKGSMTSEILAKVLDYLDGLGVYPRTEGGLIPFCLFDAHDSRLQVPFLEKVNQKIFGRPVWKVCIGLPNGTSKWQVGDSKEQNGSWKMAMTREKDKLVAFKRRNDFKTINFQRLDVIPLVV
jgi:hypothetical protein